MPYAVRWFCRVIYTVYFRKLHCARFHGALSVIIRVMVHTTGSISSADVEAEIGYTPVAVKVSLTCHCVRCSAAFIVRNSAFPAARATCGWKRNQGKRRRQPGARSTPRSIVWIPFTPAIRLSCSMRSQICPEMRKTVHHTPKMEDRNASHRSTAVGIQTFHAPISRGTRKSR